MGFTENNPFLWFQNMYSNPSNFSPVPLTHTRPGGKQKYQEKGPIAPGGATLHNSYQTKRGGKSAVLIIKDHQRYCISINISILRS